MPDIFLLERADGSVPSNCPIFPKHCYLNCCLEAFGHTCRSGRIFSIHELSGVLFLNTSGRKVFDCVGGVKLPVILPHG